MNEPFTCPACATVFDLWPDALLNRNAAVGMTEHERPESVRAKCPGSCRTIYTVRVADKEVLTTE